MKIRLLLLLLAVTELTNAQRIRIHGQVVDWEKKAPIANAFISVEGKRLNVISDRQGKFDIRIPAESASDIFSVSISGYKTFETPVWSIVKSDKELIVELVAAQGMPPEIELKKGKGGEIFKTAIAKIDQNYPAKPFLLEGFYRDLKKLGDTYVSLLEAVVKIQDEDYSAPRDKHKLRERVMLQEVRKSLGYSSKFTDFFSKANLLEDMLINNLVRYRLFDDDDDFFSQLKYEKDTLYDDQKAAVIHYKKDFELTAFIDKATYGILHIETSDSHHGALEKIRDLESQAVMMHRSIDFKYVGKKLYLHNFTITSQVNWYDVATGKLKFESQLQRELLITEIHADSKERISLSEKMKNYGLQYQNQTYNNNFWSHYSPVKDTPLDKKVIADLEQDQPLEKQFRQ